MSTKHSFIEADWDPELWSTHLASKLKQQIWIFIMVTKNLSSLVSRYSKPMAIMGFPPVFSSCRLACVNFRNSTPDIPQWFVGLKGVLWHESALYHIMPCQPFRWSKCVYSVLTSVEFTNLGTGVYKFCTTDTTGPTRSLSRSIPPRFFTSQLLIPSPADSQRVTFQYAVRQAVQSPSRMCVCGENPASSHERGVKLFSLWIH